MNAMTNFTLRSLRSNRVRTAVTIVGVVLAAALLTAVLTSCTSLVRFLYNCEIDWSGTWTALVQVPGQEASGVGGATSGEAAGELSAGDFAVDSDTAAGLPAYIEDALQDVAVDDSAVLTDVGFGQLDEQQEGILGYYLPIVSMQGNGQEVCAIRPSEGRLPERSGEIMLYHTWKNRQGVTLGDTFTIGIGQRRAVAVYDKSDVVTGEVIDAHTGNVEGTCETHDGTILDSSASYLDATSDGGVFNEKLTDVHERTYTVVGFYDDCPSALSFNTGAAAVTTGDPEAIGASSVYLSITNVSTSDEVQQEVERLFPDRYVSVHSSLLRYSGIDTGGAIWDTVAGLAAILAVVIVVACASLIYNAFAISVAERMRQFGLLSSIGASRRQLRRAVLLEAGVVALIGIPVGLVVGVAGCAATFAGLGSLLSQVLGNENVPFAVSVDAAALAFAAALTLLTVLISASVPALRAGRVVAIESLRQETGARTRRAAERAAARAVNPKKLWKVGGPLRRLLGVGGQLAAINKKRGTSRGRVASVSLALAIVLLMTAGSLDSFLGALVNVAGEGVPYDIAVCAAFAPDDDETNLDDLSGEEEGNVVDGVDVERAYGISLDDAVGSGASEDMLSADEVADYGKVYDALCGVEGTEALGWTLEGQFGLIVPSDMAGSAFNTSALNTGAELFDVGPTVQGDYATVGNVVFVSDDAFDTWAKACGQDPAGFHDKNDPRAIALASVCDNDGVTYQLHNAFADTGEVHVLVSGTYRDTPIEGFSLIEESGTYSFQPYIYDSTEDVLDDVSMDKIEVNEVEVDVVALANTPPDAMGQRAEPTLVMPVSMAVTWDLATDEVTFTAAFNVQSGSKRDASDAMNDAAGTLFDNGSLRPVLFYAVNNYAAELESSRMLATVVNVFCLLFTVILTLIALANVFNTVTNGLILRRREFAVMKSIGLSGREFRRMIASECASFSLHGLIAGLLVSIGVSYLLYVAVSQSLSGLTFSLPWGYVALAVALTAATMALAVAFGMHRCKTDNVVDVLRADGV